MKLHLLGIQHSPQDHLRHQVVQVEDIILLQVEAATTQIKIDQLPAAPHTIDHLEQIRVLGPPLLMEEANLQATALEIHQVDLRILPILVAQAGLVLAVP